MFRIGKSAFAEITLCGVNKRGVLKTKCLSFAKWLASRESYCKGEIYCLACKWFTGKDASHKPMYSNYCPHCGSVMENTKN